MQTEEAGACKPTSDASYTGWPFLLSIEHIVKLHFVAMVQKKS